MRAANSALIAIGVGASAGGLEALTELLGHLPNRTGTAFIVATHLDPHHQNALPELLSSGTRMPVREAQNGTCVEPDCVYVLPPDTSMRISGGALALEARPPAAGRHPIDALFSSLADQFGACAVGVLLSGDGCDGTFGLNRIKAKGGITFAQDGSARFHSMPRTAIAAGVVDFVLPPREIAGRLAAIAERTVRVSRAAGEWAGEQPALERILLLLRNRTGVDFRQYKRPKVLRRLSRHMLLRGSENVSRYLELLESEPAEVESLFDDLLINVTDFFRDPGVFETAARVAFPSLIRDRGQTCSVRVWVPGCSSGEEVYSLAIALTEFFEAEKVSYNLQIFGTDISAGAIARARAGVYGENLRLCLSPQRLARFFVRTENGYRICRAVRDACAFSRHNLTRDPPLSGMDVISCRNLLIYFATPLQQRILGAFARALRPEGCLILGTSETLGGMAPCFDTLDEPARIFRRRLDAPANGGRLEKAAEALEPAPYPIFRPEPHGLYQLLPEIALADTGASGVVVDSDLRILETRGDPSEYFTASSLLEGPLMDSLRSDLRAPLGSALSQARQTRGVAVAECAGGAAGEPASLTVVPLSLAGSARQFLILFGEPPDDAGALPDAEAGAGSLEGQNQRLKRELWNSRRQLQSVIEQLRSTNEDAQAANDELQSTNEQLQAAKEELQNSNEELSSIIDEMQSRNGELSKVNDDLLGLVDSMNLSVVLTGRDLRIRRFTRMAERTLRMAPTDVGRPMSDFQARIQLRGLEQILRRVLDTLEWCEQEVRHENGQTYLLRVRPCITGDNYIDGTVLQLLEVSQRGRGVEEARQARDSAEAIVDAVRATNSLP